MAQIAQSPCVQAKLARGQNWGSCLVPIKCHLILQNQNIARYILRSSMHVSQLASRAAGTNWFQMLPSDLLHTK